MSITSRRRTRFCAPEFLARSTLAHPPGEAQVDFGEATIKLDGMAMKVALFVMPPMLSLAFVSKRKRRVINSTTVRRTPLAAGQNVRLQGTPEASARRLACALHLCVSCSNLPQLL